MKPGFPSLRTIFSSTDAANGKKIASPTQDVTSDSKSAMLFPRDTSPSRQQKMWAQYQREAFSDASIKLVDLHLKDSGKRLDAVEETGLEITLEQLHRDELRTEYVQAAKERNRLIEQRQSLQKQIDLLEKTYKPWQAAQINELEMTVRLIKESSGPNRDALKEKFNRLEAQYRQQNAQYRSTRDPKLAQIEKLNADIQQLEGRLGKLGSKIGNAKIQLDALYAKAQRQRDAVHRAQILQLAAMGVKTAATKGVGQAGINPPGFNKSAAASQKSLPKAERLEAKHREWRKATMNFYVKGMTVFSKLAAGLKLKAQLLDKAETHQRSAPR